MCFPLLGRLRLNRCRRFEQMLRYKYFPGSVTTKRTIAHAFLSNLGQLSFTMEKRGSQAKRTTDQDCPRTVSVGLSLTSRRYHSLSNDVYTLPNLITMSRIVASPYLGYLIYQVDFSPSRMNARTYACMYTRVLRTYTHAHKRTHTHTDGRGGGGGGGGGVTWIYVWDREIILCNYELLKLF